MRVYPLHFYNEQGWLKIPAPLWICFAVGLQHLWFLVPTVRKVLPELGELQLDYWLVFTDLLVVLLLLSIGHRMAAGGLSFMRGIWKKGWFLLVAAYCLALIGFSVQRWEVIVWPGHRLHDWSLLVLALNALPLAYLFVSQHARDVFTFAPSQLVRNPDSMSESFFAELNGRAISKQDAPGVAMRKREAEGLLDRYPVSEAAAEPEKLARDRLASNLEDHKLWHDLGIFYLKQNLLNQATDFVRHASLIDGANAIYLRNLGELCRRCGRLQEAVEVGSAAVKLSPKDPEAFYNLGVIYTTAKNLKQAERHYLKALDLNPDHVMARQNLGFLQAGNPT